VVFLPVWNQAKRGRLADGAVGVVVEQETVVSSIKPISPAFAFGQAVASGENGPSDGVPSIVPELPARKGYLLPEGDVVQFDDQPQAPAKGDLTR
jgi:hypothetical protein